MLSATSHSHGESSHRHELTSPGHEHSLNIDNKRINNNTGASNAYTTHGTSDGTHYTLLHDWGAHHHATDNTHNHNSITFTGGAHGADHGESGETAHGHGSDDTVGTGANAVGTNGPEHQHTFDNRPISKTVRFFVKVNEP